MYKIKLKFPNIIFIVSKIFILFFIVSCGVQKDSPETKEITFWHFWSEPYQRVVIDSLIKEFEEINNCTVNVSELSWNDGKTKLFAAFNSKTAPDVLELGSDWVAQFSSVGVLMQMDEQEFEIDKFIDFSLSPSYWNGNLYAIPWIVDTRVMFYNQDLISQAQADDISLLTYTGVLELAQRINSISGVYGFGANSSDPHRLYKKIIPTFWSNGGEILDEAGNPVINSPENVKALEMYIKLSQNGILETQREIDAAFTQGKVGIWQSGAWLIKKIQNENPSLNYKMELLPGFNGKPGISFAGGEYIAISKDTKNADLAKKFVKYFTDGKQALEFCKIINEAGFPADGNYYEKVISEEVPYKEIFARQLMSSKITPIHPKWLEIESVIEDATVETLYGRKTAQESLDDAQKKLEEVLN
jgi:multiple sugar transport system substrate-binding protein